MKNAELSTHGRPMVGRKVAPTTDKFWTIYMEEPTQKNQCSLAISTFSFTNRVCWIIFVILVEFRTRDPGLKYS